MTGYLATGHPWDASFENWKASSCSIRASLPDHELWGPAGASQRMRRANLAAVLHHRAVRLGGLAVQPPSGFSNSIFVSLAAVNDTVQFEYAGVMIGDGPRDIVRGTDRFLLSYL
jgi:hypothetical protein